MRTRKRLSEEIHMVSKLRPPANSRGKGPPWKQIFHIQFKYSNDYLQQVCQLSPDWNPLPEPPSQLFLNARTAQRVTLQMSAGVTNTSPSCLPEVRRVNYRTGELTSRQTMRKQPACYKCRVCQGHLLNRGSFFILYSLPSRSQKLAQFYQKPERETAQWFPRFPP